LKREFDEIKWLNINPKPDKECIKHGDIALISEIIMNSTVQDLLYQQRLDRDPFDLTYILNKLPSSPIQL